MDALLLWDTSGMGIRFAGRTEWVLASNRLTQVIAARRADGLGMVDLTESNPTRVGLRYPAELLEPLASAAVLQYEPNAVGMLSARQAVAEYYGKRVPAQAVRPERMVLTTSTSEGYAHAFRLLCDAGDEVLVPEPSYPLLQFLADLQDVKLRHYALVCDPGDRGWQIDFTSVRAAITAKTRAIVLVHPNNPTGSAVSAGEREELNQIAAELGLALVVDEVFLDYGLADERLGAAACLRSFAGNEGALTITLSGLSKICCLPQMKLGWMVVSGPAELAADAMARLEVIADTFLSVGTPVQVAAPVMLGQRGAIQRQLLERVRTNLRELDDALAALPACLRLAVEAGWYAIVRVPNVGSEEELAVRMVEECGVLVHPGHFFDFRQEGYLVLSLIVPEAVFREGLTRMAPLLAAR